MDFSAIFQLRTKKFWWMDVIFYFVISLLIATILCYLIFLVKNNMQRGEIKNEIAALKTVGTDQQKEYETAVVGYQKKIGDFSTLLKNHEFASNVFTFMQKQTMPNVWFKQFNLDKKGNSVQLSGESDDMDAFSRQVANFESEENKKYVKNVGTINSSLGEAARVTFSMNLTLNQSIFGYIAPPPAPASTITVQQSQLLVPPEQTVSETGTTPATTASPGGSTVPVTTPTTPPATTTTPPVPTQQGATAASQAKSSEKLITSFQLLLSPAVNGAINQANNTITLNVPFGTDVKNLTPLIVVSTGATVLPASNLSQSFTSPVDYKVTAEDGSVQDYTATIIVAAAPPQAPKKSSNFLIIIWVVAAVAAIAVIAVFILRKMRVKKINPQP